MQSINFSRLNFNTYNQMKSFDHKLFYFIKSGYFVDIMWILLDAWIFIGVYIKP